MATKNPSKYEVLAEIRKEMRKREKVPIRLDEGGFGQTLFASENLDEITPENVAEKTGRDVEEGRRYLNELELEGYVAWDSEEGVYKITKEGFDVLKNGPVYKPLTRFNL